MPTSSACSAVSSPAPRTGGGAGKESLQALRTRPHSPRHHAVQACSEAELKQEVKEESKVSRTGALQPSPRLLLRASVDSSLRPAALSLGPSVAHWARPPAHIFPASAPSSCPAGHPGNGGGHDVTQIRWEVPISHAQSWGLSFLPSKSKPQPRPGSPLGSVPCALYVPVHVGFWE